MPLVDHRYSVIRAGVVIAALGLACIMIGAHAGRQGAPDAPRQQVDQGAGGSSDRSVVGPHATSAPSSDGRAPSGQPGCRPVDRPFRPRAVVLPGATGANSVVAVRRDARGVPGVPPLTDTGKQQFAWDEDGIRPGAARGNVLMNAHTWPDGTALGNALLGRLDVGDLLIVRGSAGRRLCYRVVDRLVTAYPATPQRVLSRYYATAGRPQLAITVCSGLRSDPGTWTRRTLWFAEPLGGSG